MKLSLDKIRLDGGTQPRAEMHDDVVAEYAELMAAGVKFPPVVVFFDGEQYWLADGFHRIKAAARHAADQPIEVKIFQGTLSDAQWYSYGVNKAHGLRRSNEDKERAVKTALAHPNAKGLSNVLVAEHCGVAEGTVRKYRKSTSQITKLEATEVADDHDEPPRRIGRDGRTRNTTNIGKRKQTAKSSSFEPLTPIRGLSKPCPMIPVQFSPKNAKTAAATLWQLFPRDFCEQLVQELSQRLTQGESA